MAPTVGVARAVRTASGARSGTADARHSSRWRTIELAGLVRLGRRCARSRTSRWRPAAPGLAVDAQHAALDVWWVGAPPERVQRLVDAPPSGLVVRLHPAAYDDAATTRAVDGLMRRYPVIHAASPESDGSGVDVETTAEGRRSLPSAAVLTQQAGMPVRITVSEPPVPA